jgi:putative transposase
VKEARDIIETWRMDYDEVRPHSSLDNLSPREFMENTEKTLIHGGL